MFQVPGVPAQAAPERRANQGTCCSMNQCALAQGHPPQISASIAKANLCAARETGCAYIKQSCNVNTGYKPTQPTEPATLEVGDQQYALYLPFVGHNIEMYIHGRHAPSRMEQRSGVDHDLTAPGNCRDRFCVAKFVPPTQ